MANIKENVEQDEYDYEYEDKGLVEVKVSSDGGDTWHWRNINMASGLDESGLAAGELFQFNGEKYRVSTGVDGLIAEQIKRQAKQTKRSK